MAKLHFSFDNREAAKTCFTKALELDNDSAEAWSLLGQTCMRAEELTSALNCARAAASREPHNLDYRSGLAEVHLKLDELDKAENEYRKVLAVAPNCVDALVGLGKTYLAMGSDLQKGGRSSDAESMFARALDQFSQATSVACTKRRSKPLSPGEEAALCYTRGYANVARYESQTVAKRDEKFLDNAIAAFGQVPKGDANFYKAQRAKAKIVEQRQVIDRSARWGAWIVVAVALVTLLVANLEFLVGKPGLTRTFQVTDRSVQWIKSAKAPEEVASRVEALSRRGGLSKAAFEAELGDALGDEWTKKFGDALRRQASTELTPGWQESIEAGYYALLSFGALMFLVAGLYLQQLSKLKFGGFELEKTSEATTKVVSSLGITP